MNDGMRRMQMATAVSRKEINRHSRGRSEENNETLDQDSRSSEQESKFELRKATTDVQFHFGTKSEVPRSTNSDL